jgi:hypothetical protein
MATGKWNHTACGSKPMQKIHGRMPEEICLNGRRAERLLPKAVWVNIMGVCNYGKTIKEEQGKKG